MIQGTHLTENGAVKQSAVCLYAAVPIALKITRLGDAQKVGFPLKSGVPEYRCERSALAGASIGKAHVWVVP